MIKRKCVYERIEHLSHVSTEHNKEIKLTCMHNGDGKMVECSLNDIVYTPKSYTFVDDIKHIIYKMSEQ